MLVMCCSSPPQKNLHSLLSLEERKQVEYIMWQSYTLKLFSPFHGKSSDNSAASIFLSLDEYRFFFSTLI